MSQSSDPKAKIAKSKKLAKIIDAKYQKRSITPSLKLITTPSPKKDNGKPYYKFKDDNNEYYYVSKKQKRKTEPQ